MSTCYHKWYVANYCHLCLITCRGQQPSKRNHFERRRHLSDASSIPFLGFRKTKNNKKYIGYLLFAALPYEGFIRPPAIPTAVHPPTPISAPASDEMFRVSSLGFTCSIASQHDIQQPST